PGPIGRSLVFWNAASFQAPFSRTATSVWIESRAADGVHQRDVRGEEPHVRHAADEPRSLEPLVEQALVKRRDRAATLEVGAVEGDEVSVFGKRRGERGAAAVVPAGDRFVVEPAHRGFVAHPDIIPLENINRHTVTPSDSDTSAIDCATMCSTIAMV